MPDKPSLLQYLVDKAAMGAGGSDIWDSLTSKLLYDEDDQYHPKGVRKGSVENVIKALGLRVGTLISPDIPYLEQYIHPDSDVLPKTQKPPMRPGRLQYREPLYEPHPDGGLVVSPEGLGSYGKVNPKTGYKTRQDRYSPEDTNVFDVWDFNTPSGMIKDAYGGGEGLVNELAKRLLQSAGTPYAVYGPERK